jgi:hypothetical protein
MDESFLSVERKSHPDGIAPSGTETLKKVQTGEFHLGRPAKLLPADSGGKEQDLETNGLVYVCAVECTGEVSF